MFTQTLQKFDNEKVTGILSFLYTFFGGYYSSGREEGRK
jgi:hypothetical protein